MEDDGRVVWPCVLGILMSNKVMLRLSVIGHLRSVSCSSEFFLRLILTIALRIAVEVTRVCSH
jgi:hypothetical protein